RSMSIVPSVCSYPSPSEGAPPVPHDGGNAAPPPPLLRELDFARIVAFVNQVLAPDRRKLAGLPHNRRDLVDPPRHPHLPGQRPLPVDAVDEIEQRAG